MEQTYDLTQGNIKRQLIYLSIPLLIGSIFQQFYNTIDSIIVGTYVGHDAFAAIGISGTVMNLFIFIIMWIINQQPLWTMLITLLITF